MRDEKYVVIVIAAWDLGASKPREAMGFSDFVRG